MQNPPSPKQQNWFVRRANKDSVPEFTVCGYEFTEEKTEDSLGITEGFSPYLNFRRAFIPEAGHYWLSRDYAGQELKILANLSGEKAWINAFLNNEDVHKATAVAIWGEENFSPAKRKAAKTVNFGIIYGTSAKSLAESLEITEKEAETIISDFFKSLPSIKRYLDGCERAAKENREISNIYGRKRRMHNFINFYGELTPSGARRSYNHPIQSLGAEILKVALINIYNNLLTNPAYAGKVYFMNTIHDEINLSVEHSVINEVTKLAGDLMEHKIKGMPVTIVTDIEIGTSMGLLWKFEQNLETLELTPKYVEKF